MIVDIQEVLRLQARLGEINAVPLEQIQWTDGGQPVEIPLERIREWRFVGLTNVWFITTGAYQVGVAELQP